MWFEFITLMLAEIIEVVSRYYLYGQILGLCASGESLSHAKAQWRKGNSLRLCAIA